MPSVDSLCWGFIYPKQFEKKQVLEVDAIIRLLIICSVYVTAGSTCCQKKNNNKLRLQPIYQTDMLTILFVVLSQDHLHGNMSLTQ